MVWFGGGNCCFPTPAKDLPCRSHLEEGSLSSNSRVPSTLRVFFSSCCSWKYGSNYHRRCHAVSSSYTPKDVLWSLDIVVVMRLVVTYADARLAAWRGFITASKLEQDQVTYPTPRGTKTKLDHKPLHESTFNPYKNIIFLD